MRNDGYYVTVDNNGVKSLCDVTYLKTIAKIKKAFNTQYANTYATLHIVKVENGIETIVYVKQFDAVRKTNWVTTNRTTEAGWNDLASFQPAEAEAEVENQPVENQPVENQPVENQPVENQPVENQPVENQPVENQPAEADSQPADYYKKYVCILSEIQNQDNEYFRKYKLFDVSKEVNNDNIKKFADNYIKGLTGEAYIIEKTGTFYWIVSQKKYKIKGQTKWITKEKNSTCKAFVDLFRKNS